MEWWDGVVIGLGMGKYWPVRKTPRAGINDIGFGYPGVQVLSLPRSLMAVVFSTALSVGSWAVESSRPSRPFGSRHDSGSTRSLVDLGPQKPNGKIE